MLSNDESRALAYPLQWPAGYPRTKRPTRARFSVRRQVEGRSYSTSKQVPLAEARNHLLAELARLGAKYIVISSNLPVRLDGLPRAGQREPDDAGVAVYFYFQDAQRVFCCDTWNRVADNLRALAKSVEAMRGMDRWGASSLLQGMFSGFKALPEQGASGGAQWWEVLGVTPDASAGEIKTAFREQAKRAHPDKGGTQADWNALSAAYEQARHAAH